MVWGEEREILITAAETAVGRRRVAAAGAGLRFRRVGSDGGDGWSVRKRNYTDCVRERGPMRVRPRRAYNYEIPGIN